MREEKFQSDVIEQNLLMVFQRMQQLQFNEIPEAKLNLTISQMQLIRFVGKMPGCHIQDAAEGLGVSSPTVSVSIRKLEDEDLIERQPDPEDGRASCLFLTRKSQKAFKEMRAAMLLRMRTFLSHLAVDEQSRLVELMEKAVSGLESEAQRSKQ